VLDGERAIWYPADAGRETLALDDGRGGRSARRTGAPGDALALASRPGRRHAVDRGRGDPLGRFVLDRLAAASALALPLADRTPHLRRALRDPQRRQVRRGGARNRARAYSALAVERARAGRALRRTGRTQRRARRAAGGDSRFGRCDFARRAHAASGAVDDLASSRRRRVRRLPERTAACCATVWSPSTICNGSLRRCCWWRVSNRANGVRSSVFPVDLAELVREVGSEIGAMAESRGVR
jgi:hypothetical protein